MTEAKGTKKGKEKKRKSERKWETEEWGMRGLKRQKKKKIEKGNHLATGQSAKLVGFYVPYV